MRACVPSVFAIYFNTIQSLGPLSSADLRPRVADVGFGFECVRERQTKKASRG